MSLETDTGGPGPSGELFSYDGDSGSDKGKVVAEVELSTPAATEAQGPPVRKLKYPKQVFFIVTNEGCERFSYYGMRTILTLFLVDVLLYDDNSATVIYHVFVCLCYFFPIIGGIIADTWLGKFKTVAYISVIYAAGNIVVSLSSVMNWNLSHDYMCFAGLLLIAIGTGGIKPCVSSFGGDQYTLPDQERQLSTFFSVFYFSINFGSLISTYLTPDLRSLSCLGQDTCYPLAFGVPAVLMIVSLVVFVAGYPMYKIKEPEGNVMVEVSKCMWNAWMNKIKSKKSDVRKDWLEYADAKYSEKLREDIRILLKTLLIFAPLPVFWALYEQQGSRWTIQADNMNGNFNGYVIQPDQMQIINPLLILILLPVFEKWLYPWFIRLGVINTPLQKMSLGGMIGALAFVISGVLQIYIQNSPGYIKSPTSGYADIHLLNTLPCNATFTITSDQYNDTFILDSKNTWFKQSINVDVDNATMKFAVDGTCASGSFYITPESETSRTYLVYEESSTPYVYSCSSADDYTKEIDPEYRLLYKLSNSSVKYTITLQDSSSGDNTTVTTSEEDECSSYTSMDPATYKVYINGTYIGEQFMDIGGLYTIAFHDDDGYIATIVHANSVNIMWIVPEYVVITVAEVFLSVTGYEFAFTQAPISMKSVVSSIYLLTDAIGNLIVIFVAEVDFLPSQSDEYFLFAGLMVVAMLGFIVLSMRYKYVMLVDEDDLPPALPNGEMELAEKKEEDQTRF